MKKFTRRFFFKLVTFFQIFSLALQPLSLMSLLVLDPVVAHAEDSGQAKVEVEQKNLNLIFDQEKNNLELRAGMDQYADANLDLNYSLTYVNDQAEEKIEQAVMGQLNEIEEDVYGADIYLGTCSGDDCSDDYFNKGSVRIGEDYQSDFILEDDKIWFKQNDGHKYITGSDVELGKKYVAPQNSDVIVTFSELPEKTSPLSIEEITLTEEEIQATGAVSDKAYDITTAMEDGSFKFDLTLPSADETTEVVFVEERADILTEVREVEQEVVKENNVVKVKDLDHLTIWIATYSNPALTVSSDTFALGETIYIEATDLNKSNDIFYKIKIINSIGEVDASDCVKNKESYKYDYDLQMTDEVGDKWEARIDQYTDDSCNTLSDPRQGESTKFEVTEIDENSDRIRICHRTKSHVNPYIVNNPSKSGDVSGHADHGPDDVIWYEGIDEEWGDIIPTFDYGDNQHYDGKNWSSEGQTIYYNNCEAGIDGNTLVVHKLYEDETDGFVSGDGNDDFAWSLDKNEFYPFGETVDRPDNDFTIYETMPVEYELRGWFYGNSGNCTDDYAEGDSIDIEVEPEDGDLEITICNQLAEETRVYCGDGNVNAQNEQCDDGNKNDSDYCNNLCQFNDAVCLPHENMLVNGGFEELDVDNDYEWDIFDKYSPMLGWAVEWSGGSNTYNDETRPESALLELHRGVNGWLPKSGDQYAELDTDWDGPGQPLNNEPATVRISQNISILDGYKYKVEFAYSPRPGQGVANNSMDFELDGSMVNNYSASGSENTNWTPVSYEFTADEDAIRTVSFVERGTADSLGMFIDDVSVYCLGKEVPECVEEGLVWADEVESVVAGTLYNGNVITDPIRIDPEEALGEADGDFYSLGKGGEIILNFYYYIANVSGDDLSIHEITWNRTSDIEETAKIYVKNDHTDWKYLGEASSFSDGNGDTIPDGINYFDLSSVKLPWINAVKLIESSQGQAGYDDGFDLDAIDATKRVCEEPVIEYGSIQGRKYHDLNLSGSFDNFEKNETGDPNRLDGWKINLFDDQWNLIDFMNTGDDNTTAGNVGKGQYKFVNLFAGRYYVCEEQKEGWYQTEPSSGPKYENEGPYCHVIDVAPGQNVNTIQFGNYQGSDLEICKVDNKNRPQNGWEVVLASEKVDGPRSINVSDNTGTNSTSLPAGKYLIKVTGTYQYGNTSMIADAGFSYRPLSIPSGCNCWLSGFDLSGGSKGLMAWVNETPVNWGAYNDGDSYTYVYDHSSEGPINISIWDNYYDDNLNNNFQFEIYEIPENYYGITEDDGCVSFNAVAFGDYILDESLKENWINLSGKGSLVKIDSLEESFTLKNRIDAPVEIVATKIVCDLEGYLPNYGSGGPNITSTTAQNWVSESEGHCWLEPDWSFQWGNQAASTPVNDYAEAIGWNTFGPTDSNGQTRVEINNLDGINQIKVREVLKENYIPFTYPDNRDNFSAEIYCHTDVLNYDNDDRFTPEYGQTYYCVAWNTVLRSDVHGYKWEDLNGNGERDCIVEENNLDETSAEERQVCELEPLLSGWTINLYRSNGEGGFELSPFKSMLTDSSQDDLGWYWFEDLLPGQYKICESNQGDWVQSFPKNEEDNCHIVNLPDDNPNGYPATTNYLEYPEPEYNFGNYLPISLMMIEKTNNVWPTDQSIGDEVTYTIRLMAIDGPVYDVSLFDLPPNAFSYVADSYTANSSVRGDLITSIPEPTYASPGEWQLGNLAKDEIITLTYKAIIGDEADAGIYPDMAWAIGTSAQAQNLEEEGADLLALSGEEGYYGEEYFVGTQVAIVLDETLADKYEVEKIEEVEGQVLGASTGLPATGARFWLSILALLSMLTGAGLLLLPNRSKRRQGKALLVLLMFGLGLFMAKPVQALTSVRIGQPYNTSAELDQDAMTNQEDFRIDFVILNTDNLSLDAQCQQQENGGAWVDIETVYTIKAGGNSGCCQAEDLNDDSQYTFRVIASDGSETKISDKVKVGLETDRPEKPKDYDKDEIGSCEYEIEFKTADDGCTVRVEVYRSDDNESFTAKASSRIKTINIGSDEEYSFETTKPDCDKDYYYAIRAFDEYGNASDLVGDREIKTVIIEGTEGETIVTLGALPVTETVVLGEGEIGEGLSTEGTETGALAEGLSAEEIGEEEGGKILGVKTESIMSFLTRVGLPILVGGTVLFLLYRLFFAKRHEK